MIANWRNRYPHWLLGLVLLLSVGSHLEAQNYDGWKIESIDWTPEPERVSGETYLFYLGLEVGERLDLAVLNQKIHELWDREFLNDLGIHYEEGEKGVKLTISLMERPVLRSVDYKGLKKLSRLDVGDRMDLERIRLDEGAPLKPGELDRLKSEMIEMYRDKGYRFAEISYSLDPSGPGEVVVIYSVDEGDKVKIGEIVFEGNSVVSDRRLRWTMKGTKKSNMVTRLRKKDLFNPASYEEDIDLVRALYREKGYKNVLFGEPEISVTGGEGKKRRISLTIPVDEGERWKLGGVTIEGNEVYSDELLLAAFPERRTDWLKYSFIDEAVEAIDDVYRNTGYLYSRIQTEVKEREGIDERIADVVVHVDEGDQYRVHRLEFEGNTRTRDKVLRREFRVHEGQVLNMAALRNSVLKLQQLEYFTVDEDEPIEFVNFDTDKKTVDLMVKGQESDRTEVLFGGGWSQPEGFFGQVSLRTRNFLGRGETASIGIQSGGISDEYDLSYFVPWFLDRPQSVGVQIFDRELEFDLANTQTLRRASTGIVLTYGRNLGLFSSFSVNYNLSDFEDFRRTVIDGDEVTQDFELGNRSITPLWSFDSRDSRILPTRGKRLMVSLEYAGDVLGGQNNFLRPEIRASLFQSLTRYPLQTIFAVNLEAGWLFPSTDDPISPLETYFNGGDNSIRGFNRRTISVRDEDGELLRDETGFFLGGHKYVEFSLEYHVVLGGPFRMIFFGDAGNVFGEDQSIDFSLMRYSAGTELRIFTPILGVPLRFIYAFNLDEKPGDSFDKFSFSVGTSF